MFVVHEMRTGARKEFFRFRDAFRAFRDAVRAEDKVGAAAMWEKSGKRWRKCYASEHYPATLPRPFTRELMP